MTTEIAVINRLGVALATDSAVTITNGGNEFKVFDTGDKLFELSETAPVGVMVNGNLDFLGVPWEIIIKDFRDASKNGDPVAIDGWLDNLLEFTQGHKAFNDEAELTFVLGIAREEFRTIKGIVFDRLFGPAAGPHSNPDVPALVTQVAEERRAEYAKSSRADSLKPLSADDVRKKYAKTLNSIIDKSFHPAKLGNPHRLVLRKLVVEALMGGGTSDYTTGIIVAGFGAGDIFPSLTLAEIDGSVAGVLKYSKREHVEINRDRSPGRVISFCSD